METASMTGSDVVMTTIEHVLAPLDGTAAAEAALRWLHSFPVRSLTLLRVCERETTSSAEAETYLTTVAAPLATAQRLVTTRVLIGCPAETIVEAASGADFVVMATGARGGGGRLLFGSVADRVARHSPAPTLLLRHGTVPDQPTAICRLVVPLDGSPAAERALSPAIALAHALDCPIHLVTVDDPSDADAMDEQLLRQAAAGIEAQGCSASTERRAGDAARQLLNAVSPGDLLVITTHGRGAARRWQIGGVAEKLLRQATAPVVLVRADTR